LRWPPRRSKHPADPTSQSTTQGVGPAGLIPTADISIDDWRRVLATNLDGRLLLDARRDPGPAADGRWLDRQHVVGDRGRRLRRVRRVRGVEARVLGLTRTAAIEYGREGIRVNTVGPGTTETPLTRDAIASEGEKIVRRFRSAASRPGGHRAARRALASDALCVLHRRLVRGRRRLTATSSSARGGALGTAAIASRAGLGRRHDF
jgi:NAD(P)-dependent dehydrogenase (short-subunit alcohol dehydrogenase family)